jgi:hypothetical protein
MAGPRQAADALRRAPRAADAVIDAADPIADGRNRRAAQRGGPGDDPLLSKLRDLKDGGQRSPQQAARPPGEHPHATPHGRGVHNAAQHNRRTRDQHRRPREQGEGREPQLS